MSDTNTQDTGAITFTPEQQTFVNNLIREKQGVAASEVRAQLTAKEQREAQLVADLAAAQAELAVAKTTTEKKEAKGDVALLQAQLDEVKSVSAGLKAKAEAEKARADAAATAAGEARQEADTVRKTVAITNAASKVSFIDASVVTKLTAEFIKYDSARGTFVVMGDNGQERMNSSFAPMSLDEFYSEFAAKNPYLVKPDARGGTGSTESQKSGLSNNGKFQVTDIFGTKSNGKLANDLKISNPTEYHRLKAIAKQSGLI